MDIFPTATPATAAARQSDVSGTASMITADFQTFLRMLTTQMQNQDPLNPMESTEFASQLAQFSGVEQQVRTNELLTGMQAGLATLGMGELVGWVGMEARAQMPVRFDGQPVRMAGTPHALADRMELIVYDDRGQVVQQVPVPLRADDFEWDGTDPSGTTLPPGDYTVRVQNWSGETMLDEQSAMVHARVDEARMVDGQIWLTMESGLSIPAASVLGLRNPV